MRGGVLLLFLASFFFIGGEAWSQSPEIKDIKTRISWYRSWLEKTGSKGTRLWLRLDSSKRPHRLYVSDGFVHAQSDTQEELIEIFSRYLAGHPDKNMLIDIYSVESGKMIGEYGFGGFRLFQSQPSVSPVADRSVSPQDVAAESK